VIAVFLNNVTCIFHDLPRIYMLIREQRPVEVKGIEEAESKCCSTRLGLFLTISNAEGLSLPLLIITYTYTY